MTAVDPQALRDLAAHVRKIGGGTGPVDQAMDAAADTIDAAEDRYRHAAADAARDFYGNTLNMRAEIERLRAEVKRLRDALTAAGVHPRMVDAIALGEGT